jgi:DNA topoisomerase I
VLNSYLDGNLVLEVKSQAESELRADVESLKPEEAAVLALVRGRLAKEAERSAEEKRRAKPTCRRSGKTQTIYGTR